MQETANYLCGRHFAEGGINMYANFMDKISVSPEEKKVIQDPLKVINEAYRNARIPKQLQRKATVFSKKK